MSSGQSGWLLLLILALMMITIGIQGNLGTLVAVLFSPANIVVEA
jgi:hypothetical protein